MRFLVQEDENTITREEYNHIVAGAKKGNYEELISVKEKGKKHNQKKLLKYILRKHREDSELPDKFYYTQKKPGISIVK